MCPKYFYRLGIMSFNGYFYFFYICGTHPIDRLACQLKKEDIYENTGSVNYRKNAG